MRLEPRLMEQIDGPTKDRVAGLDNLALIIEDLAKRSRVERFALGEHGTSKPDRKEWRMLLATRGAVFQKSQIHFKKPTHQQHANRCVTGEMASLSAQRVRGVERRGEKKHCARLMRGGERKRNDQQQRGNAQRHLYGVSQEARPRPFGPLAESGRLCAPATSRAERRARAAGRWCDGRT